MTPQNEVHGTFLVGTEFKETVDGYVNSWLPAYDIVKAAIESRNENDPEGRLIMFETSGCPWKEHLFNIEEKLGIKGEILYVIYKNKETDWRIQVKIRSPRTGSSGPHSIYIQCVPVSPTSFTNRKSLPESWRGIRDEDLSKASTVADATFCHVSGFIGGAKTQTGVLQMAKLSLN